MATRDRFETTCPNCQREFDVDADAAEGNCPHCDVHLRFLEEAPTPPPESPRWETEAETAERAAEPEPPVPTFDPETTVPDAVPAPVQDAPPVSESAPPFQAGPLAPGQVQIQCPACTTMFNVDLHASESACPSCQALLTLENVYPTIEPRLSVGCPACSQSFDVALDARRGECPHCSAALTFEDRLAEEPEPYPEAVPAPVEEPSQPPPMPRPPLRPEPFPHPEPEPEPEPEPDDDEHAPRRRGLFRRFSRAPVPTPEVTEGVPGSEPAGAKEPAPPPPENPLAQAPLVVEEPPRRTGWFGRRKPKPSALESPRPDVTAEPTPVAPETVEEERPRRSRRGEAAEPAASRAEPASLPPPVQPVTEPPPYVLSCPTCSKEFTVAGKHKEGNCPHCNAPLAFLNEKEYQAMLQAEERKRAFQAKIQQQRLAERERDQARLQRAAEKREVRLKAAAEGPPEVAPAKRGWLRGRRKTASEDESATAPRDVMVEAPGPLPKEPSRRGKNKEVAKPPAAVVELESTPTIETAPAVPDTPTEAKPKRRLFGLLGRKKETVPEPDMPAVETAPEEPIAETRTRRRGKKEPAAPLEPPAAPVEVEIAIEAPARPPEPKADRGKKSQEAASLPPPVEIQVDLAASAEATPEPAAKRSLVSRFLRRQPKRDPSVGAEPAPVEVEPAIIEFGSVEVAPVSPSAPARGKGRGKGARAQGANGSTTSPDPSPVESVAIDLDLTSQASATTAPAPAKRGLLGRFRRRPTTPEGEAATVEVAGIDLGGPGPADVSPEPAKKSKKGK